MSDISSQVGNFLTTYTKPIILVTLLATVLVGVGAGSLEQQSSTGQFESDSAAADAQEYISENFSSAESRNTTIVQVIQRGNNVLTGDSLTEALSVQQSIRAETDINQTLASDRPTFSVANIIGTTAYRQQGNRDTPTLEEQQRAIQSLNESQLDGIIGDILGEDGNEQALGLLPSSYTPGSVSAESTAIVIRQRSATDVQNPSNTPQAITDAQLAIRETTQDRETEYAVFGTGLIGDEINQSLGDSGALVGPFALLFVVVALTVAYRDLLDIVLGVVGIIAVLTWTFGFMGWAGIPFNQLLLAVPVLLIGLSIDYAIHVFMRYREQRAEDESLEVNRGMSLALAGVGAALVWVTVTAALGFLANLSSPIGALRDFGIVSAFGVIAALVVYGTLIPALKIEIDGALESYGIDRHKRAFATGGGSFSRVLVGGATAARRFPVAIVVVALLLAAVGGYGATQVNTSFDETDFLADSPPEWTQSLPGPMAPGSYDVSEDLEFIGDNYQQQGSQADVLIRGDVTNEQTLRWLAAIQTDTADQQTVFVGPNGPSIRSPLTAMEETAARGEQLSATTMPAERTERQTATVEFAEEYSDATAQTDVPTGNVEELYDRLLQANPDAARFLYRTDQGYQAIRLQFGIVGNAGNGPVADDTRTVAALVRSESDGALAATPASDQVVFDNVQSDLLSTVTQGLVITLVSVFVFLSLAYRATGRPASLGFVTMIPVMLSVTWILGSMWVLDIPFNTLTGTITSLTVGLGIAYSIHVSSRYELELRRQGNVWEAMRTTVTGTGGALLGSAATTVGGFGTLAIAILPILQQFGIITGLTIIYAFLASVLVLPSLLVLWTRYLGPAAYFPDEESPPEAQETGDEQPAADGGENPS